MTTGRCRHTIVYLLKSHDRVLRQTLLRILIQQKGLGLHRARLRWGHRRSLMVGEHGGVAKRGAARHDGERRRLLSIAQSQAEAEKRLQLLCE